MKAKLRLLFFLVFCLPGLFIVGYGAQLAGSSWRLASAGSSTTGTIVSYERQTYRGRVGRRFCAVVEFPHDGAMHRFTDDWCRLPQKEHPAGASVNVVFDARAPAMARIDDWGVLYGKSLFVSAIGAPWLLLGIALVMRVR